jgi:hypothetical protein
MEKETVQVIAQVAVPILTFLLGIAGAYIRAQVKQRRVERENTQKFQTHLEIIVISIMSCNGFGAKFKDIYYENLKLNNLQSSIKIKEEF